MGLAKRTGRTAGDIMSRDLVTVPLTATLAGLALILHENHITGAPVVDDEGLLVGVVSQSDLVRHETHPNTMPRVVQRSFVAADDDPEAEEPTHAYYTHMDGADLSELRERFIEEDYGDALVADIYTPFTVTSTVETPVATLARLMVEKSVHRVIIVEGKRVVGIVTSMDILRSLAGGRPAVKGEACLVAH